jgi:hypothetical protein
VTFPAPKSARTITPEIRAARVAEARATARVLLSILQGARVRRSGSRGSGQARPRERTVAACAGPGPDAPLLGGRSSFKGRGWGGELCPPPGSGDETAPAGSTAGSSSSGRDGRTAFRVRRAEARTGAAEGFVATGGGEPAPALPGAPESIEGGSGARAPWSKHCAGKASEVGTTSREREVARSFAAEGAPAGFGAGRGAAAVGATVSLLGDGAAGLRFRLSFPRSPLTASRTSWEKMGIVLREIRCSISRKRCRLAAKSFSWWARASASPGSRPSASSQRASASRTKTSSRQGSASGVLAWASALLLSVESALLATGRSTVSTVPLTSVGTRMERRTRGPLPQACSGDRARERRGPLHARLRRLRSGVGARRARVDTGGWSVSRR